MTKKKKLHEYAYDVKLYAVVRVKAYSQKQAEEIVDEVLSSADVSEHCCRGILDTHDDKTLEITEASLTTEDGPIHLFELDGEGVEG